MAERQYEEVYLYAYGSASAVRQGVVARYFAFYNQKRPHTALDRLTSDEFYFNNLPALPKAA